jgi:hypothetical protein
MTDRMIRWSAFGFAMVFGVVVALGYLPGINAPAHGHNPGAPALQPGEHLLLGQYTISLLDDVTHALTALLLLAGAAHSARLARLGLGVFGSYYAVDAAIYLITGVLEGTSIVSNLALNVPHVVLSSTMLWLAWRGRIDAPRAIAASP